MKGDHGPTCVDVETWCKGASSFLDVEAGDREGVTEGVDSGVESGAAIYRGSVDSGLYKGVGLVVMPYAVD